MTPEEMRDMRIKKRRLARIRFRSLIKTVILNRKWLAEFEDVTLGDNVNRNVAILVRSKGQKGILSLTEKALLNTQPMYRTIEQKKQIVLLMSNLKCFAKYQPKIRSRLSRVISFQYFPKGRTVLREGHFASAMYFILDGEITVTRRKWMKYEGAWVEEPTQVLTAGDAFGEVALIEDIKRDRTCTTTANTELLCIYKSDFDWVLKDTLKAQWKNINSSLQRFEYFRYWNDAQIRECCLLGVIRQYNPLQTIYAEDKGRLSDVFFVLSGQCIILQYLKMNTRTLKNGEKQYELQDIDAMESASRELINKFHKAAERIRTTSIRESITSHRSNESHTALLTGKNDAQIPITDLPSSTYSNVKTKSEFVEVGRFSCGSVFGLGEEMKHRTIVATNYVQCLLIPRYWLFQKAQNSGNIWQCTKMYLDSSIPSRQKIFNDFLSTNDLKQYRKSLIADLARSQNRKTIQTKLTDVPIISRIEEGL